MTRLDKGLKRQLDDDEGDKGTGTLSQFLRKRRRGVAKAVEEAQNLDFDTLLCETGPDSFNWPQVVWWQIKIMIIIIMTIIMIIACGVKKDLTARTMFLHRKQKHNRDACEAQRSSSICPCILSQRNHVRHDHRSSQSSVFCMPAAGLLD